MKATRPIDPSRIGYSRRNPSVHYLKRSNTLVVEPEEGSATRYFVSIFGPTRPNGTRPRVYRVGCRYADLERMMISAAKRYRIHPVNITMSLREVDKEKEKAKADAWNAKRAHSAKAAHISEPDAGVTPTQD